MNNTEIRNISKVLSSGKFAEIAKFVKDSSWLDCSEKDDPNPMDTPGTLVDKLCTVTAKMFWNQDALYAIRRMSLKEFEEKYGNNMSELYEVLKKCTDLNAQRARLMDELDRVIAGLANGTIKPEHIVNNQHKTY